MYIRKLLPSTLINVNPLRYLSPGIRAMPFSSRTKPTSSPSSHITGRGFLRAARAMWLSYEIMVSEELPTSTNECKSNSSSTISPNPISPMLEKPTLGPYTPTLILHGGSGSISRSNLPPALYELYRSSLLKYLESTHAKLQSG